jgi:DNA-binding transcriptional ArsR family regulator
MESTPVRMRSKQLLGNAYRMELAAELAEVGKPVSAIELADATGIRYPRVHEELQRLKAAGLLVASESRGSGVVVEYTVVPSCYWQGCRDLLTETRGLSDEP